MRVTQIVGSFFDRVFARVEVSKSSISTQTGQPLYDVRGIGDPSDSDGTKPGSEERDAQEAFTSGGVLFRPPPPEKGQDLFLEALAARTSDGLVPMAFRDRRILFWLNKGGGVAPKEGQIIYAGYGGAFLAFDLVSDNRNMVMLYGPVERDGSGVPTKAHTLIFDPETNSVSLVHGDGAQFRMLADKEVHLSIEDSTWMQMKPGVFNVQADQIGLVGSVFIGNTTTGVPLVRFPEFATTYDAHTHTTGMGPSGPPLPLLTPQIATVGTTRVKGA